MSSDKVRLASIPVATISCEMARLVLLSMDVELNSTRNTANATHTRQCNICVAVS